MRLNEVEHFLMKYINHQIVGRSREMVGAFEEDKPTADEISTS
jgi:hypothetical protein